MSNEVTMPLTGHLTELRNRVLIIFGTVVGLFLITYFFSGELLVLALYARYRKVGDSFAEKYLELLESGGSDWPHQSIPVQKNLSPLLPVRPGSSGDRFF